MIKTIALTIVCLIVAVCIAIPIGDSITSKEYNTIGIIKDSDYDAPYTTTSCDSNGRNCHTTFHDEHCEVYVVGDEFDGWFGVNCHVYFTQLHLNEKNGTKVVGLDFIGDKRQFDEFIVHKSRSIVKVQCT